MSDRSSFEHTGSDALPGEDVALTSENSGQQADKRQTAEHVDVGRLCDELVLSETTKQEIMSRPDLLGSLGMVGERLSDDRYVRSIIEGTELDWEKLGQGVSQEVAEAWAKYVAEAAETMEVLQNFTLAAYLQNGWQMVGAVDVGNLNAANQIPTVGMRRGGDLLLRHAALALQKQVAPEGAKIFNLGGDELVLLVPPGAEVDPIDQEMVDQKLADAKGFYFDGGEVVERPLSLQVKAHLEGFVDDVSELPQSSLSLERRIELLQAAKEVFPTEVVSLDQALSEVSDPAIQERVVSFYEQYQRISLLDPTMEAYARKLCAIDNFRDRALLMELLWSSYEDMLNFPTRERLSEEGILAAFYSRREDFYRQLQHDGLEASEVDKKLRYVLLVVHFPGRLKDINDDPDLGYEAGNEFLRLKGMEIAQAVSAEIGTDGTLLLCRDKSFYIVAIPDQSGTLAADKEAVAERIQQLASRDFVYQGEYGDRVIPVQAVALVQEVSLIPDNLAVANESSSDISPDNQAQLNDAMRLFGQIEGKYTKKAFTERFRQVASDVPITGQGEADWLMFASYFDPFHKRASARYHEFGIDGQLLEIAKERFYDGGQFEVSKLAEYATFVREKLLGNSWNGRSVPHASE